MAYTDLKEGSGIIAYACVAMATDHTFAPICGVVRYVGKGFLVIAQSCTKYELRYVKPLLEAARNIKAIHDPEIFKRGTHRWIRAISVETEQGSVMLYTGVRLYNVICEKYGIVSPCQDEHGTYLRVDGQSYNIQDVKSFKHCGVEGEWSWWELQVRSGKIFKFNGDTVPEIVSR